MNTTKDHAPRRRRRGPGRRWRVLAHQESGPVDIRDQGVFDELVVDHWSHLERMARREWWMRVGDARLYVTLLKNGEVQVDIQRGDYGEVCGTTSVHEPGK